MKTGSHIWRKYRKAVLDRIDDFSLVFKDVGNQRPSSDGWITALCPLHADKTPSFAFNRHTGRWCCFAGCGKGSAFDYLMQTSGLNFKEALLELGDRIGVPRPASKSTSKPPIDESAVKGFVKGLRAGDKRCRWLKEHRGLTDKTLKKYEIGWEPKRGRYTIPVRDEQRRIVNIRLYNAEKDPKIVNYTEDGRKYGSPARLFGLDDLARYQGNQVILCEGEWDRLLLQQHGFMAVTGTHGASVFRLEWLPYFEGKEVIVIYDCDPQGQKAAKDTVVPALIASKTASVKNIVLPLDGDKNDKDITDYFHKRGLSADDLQTLIDKTPPYTYAEEADDEYATVSKAIYISRQKQGRDDNRRDFEINTEVTSQILSHLQQRGEFYTDCRKAYFFLRRKKQLIEIHSDNEEYRLLMHRYQINPTETVYRFILEALKNEAHANGKKTTVHRLAYYDVCDHRVYVFNHKNQMYRVTSRAIELVDNGTDGVLFLSDGSSEPFELVELQVPKPWLRDIISAKINFAEDVLTAEERRRVFELWFFSMFFETVMPTKPIMAFIGPKGSGKSMTLRRVGKLLFGDGFDVTPLTNDSKDFDAAVSNAAFVAFDNADHRSVWLNDRLAIAATGGMIRKRALYTTNELVEIPVRCFIGITSRTPHFRREDVADRLLIMRVDRIKDYEPEKALLRDLSVHRNEVMSEVILQIKEILQALESQTEDFSGTFRLADFADFSMKIARHEGWQDALEQMFAKLSHEQSEFTLEGDPIFETLMVWAGDNPDRQVTYKELWEELKQVAEKEAIDFREFAENARGFCRRIANIRSNLEEFFDITDTSKRGRTVLHAFRPKEGE